ncbi:MAG: hypothetical protein IRD4RH_01930 [Rickettsia helvetica]
MLPPLITLSGLLLGTPTLKVPSRIVISPTAVLLPMLPRILPP